MHFRFSLLFIFLSCGLQAQVSVPKDYFSPPMDGQLILSGTFGELRSNHFHSGLDIKTGGKTGVPIRAAAPGYISRIKVQQWGFGKAIYIQHPNGYVTVYGHLKSFSPSIEAYVKQRQYQQESWDLTLYPKANELKVDRGEVIALSGNTGSSGGPHLHFGIRDGAIPMNPMLFGIAIKDARHPIINSVFVYPKGKNSAVKGRGNRQKVRLSSLGNNLFKAEKITASGKIGFGISTVDLLDFAPNKDGIYKIETFVNGSNNFSIVFNKYSFSRSRYLNRFIDYAYYKTHDERIQKLFILPNNPLQIYQNVLDKGFLTIQEGKDYTYTIKVSDFAGNTSTVRIPIEGKKQPIFHPKKIKKTPYLAQSNQAFVYEKEGFDVYIPKGALYEDTYLEISAKDGKIQVHNNKTPLHKNITIGFNIDAYSPEDLKTLCIARVYPWNKYYVSTKREEHRLTTHTRTFGTYTLTTDDTAPKIEPINFSKGQWISNHTKLQLKITDDFSGISNYRATVNGKFILMEYQHKTNLITYDFSDGKTFVGENNLKIIVTDNVGNSTTFEAPFFRAH